MTPNDLRLTSEDAERYKAHTTLCEIDLPGQAALRRSSVLIVGCGGLGSPVALYLAAAGVGRIGLLDADTVGLSNLQRQIIHTTPDLGRPKVESAAEKLRAVNPGIVIEPIEGYLTAENGEEIVARYDLVADCTDSAASRLLVNDVCVKSGKPYVFGSVSRFSGMVFSYRPGASTYRELFGDSDGGAGGGEECLSCAATGVLNAVVGVVGSLQASEAIKLITGAGEPLTDSLLTLDLLTNSFQKLNR